MPDEYADRLDVHGAFVERLRRPSLAVELDLAPHPEGGWYRRTFTSPLPVHLDGDDGAVRRRPAATLIVFLLPAGESSAWHRLTSAEVWIWNGPGTVQLQYGGTGDHPDDGEIVTLGDAFEGHVVQAVVPPTVWQRTLPGERDAVVSCMVSPGFDFADFTMP